MASNGQIFWWTVAILTLPLILVLGLGDGIIVSLFCGVFFVGCNSIYQKIKGSESPRPLTGDPRPPQIGPGIPGQDQEGPRIVSITDQFGRVYPVPPRVPPTRPYAHRSGPVLQGIDYSQSECILDLSPASYYCPVCNITMCSSCSAVSSYTCPRCHAQLIPIRRVSS